MASMTESARTDPQTLRRRAQIRLLFVAIGVLIVGVAGYLGFVSFVRADNPGGSGALVLGALTGFAAFFSPCSFPLLLTFLARRGDESKPAAVATALRVGLGASLMLAIAGLAMALAGTAIGTVVQFDRPLGRAFRVVVGTVLIIFGLKQARLLNLQTSWMDRLAQRAGMRFDRSKASTKTGGDVLYGFGFLVAGFG